MLRTFIYGAQRAADIDYSTQEERAALRYFLSYSRTDASFAERLVKALRDIDVEVFVDSNIELGARWDESVQRELAAAEGVIVLLSPKAIASENVLDEVNYALDFHKRIIPIVLHPCEVPLRLRRFEWLTAVDDFDAFLPRIRSALTSGATRRTFDDLEHNFERPSLAVMPFANRSGANEANAFCDGLLTDLVTALSLNKEFFVIASSTALDFRGSDINYAEAARELGVRYVVSGTFFKDNTRLRVTAELWNAETKRSLWASRYDRESVDLFNVLDEISRAIAIQLQPRVTREEIKRVSKRSPDELSAWELFQRARTYTWDYKWLIESIELLKRAVGLDPRSAQAYALLSARSAYLLWYGEFDKIAEAKRYLSKAVEIDPEDPFVQVSGCITSMLTGQPTEALKAAERALETNPNLAEAWAYYGVAMSMEGNPKQGLSQIDMAFKLSPRDPLRYIWHLFSMICHVALEDYENAAKSGSSSIELNPSWFFVQMSQAVNYAMLGDQDRARTTWAEAKRLNKMVSVPAYEIWLQNSALDQGHQQLLVASLRDAGCE